MSEETLEMLWKMLSDIYEKTIYQLKDLIHDRESLLSGNAEYDDVFNEDIKALRVAVRVLSKADSRHINAKCYFAFGVFLGAVIAGIVAVSADWLGTLI